MSLERGPVDCTPAAFRAAWVQSREMSEDGGPTDREIEEWIDLARIDVPVCLPHGEEIVLDETAAEVEARFARASE